VTDHCCVIPNQVLGVPDGMLWKCDECLEIWRKQDLKWRRFDVVEWLNEGYRTCGTCGHYRDLNGKCRWCGELDL
jgi:hypothetical protein